MPTFKYTAQDAQGARVKGTLDANDELDLHRQLRDQGIALISAEEVVAKEKSYKQLHSKVLSSWCFKMSELLGAGVPLIRALTICAEEETNKPKETEIYLGLVEVIKQGNQLSQAMAEANGPFPELLINMVKSAEEAGNLSEVFKRMATHYEKEYKLASKVKSATIYPKILCVLIVAVVIIIVGYVLPQFESLFSQMAELPIATQILLGITDFCSENWLGIIVFVVVVVLAWNIAIRISGFRRAFDHLKLKVPLLGKNNSTLATARFARTFSSLYNSGINAITALQIASKTTGNTYIESQFDQVIAQVRSGHSLSDALSEVDGFNRKFISSVRVGEESGSLEEMLDSTADTMEFEAEQALERMVGYLEPCMIIILAVIVAFVIIAVIVPIYNSYSTISTSTTSY